MKMNPFMNLIESIGEYVRKSLGNKIYWVDCTGYIFTSGLCTINFEMNFREDQVEDALEILKELLEKLNDENQGSEDSK